MSGTPEFDGEMEVEELLRRLVMVKDPLGNGKLKFGDTAATCRVKAKWLWSLTTMPN